LLLGLRVWTVGYHDFAFLQAHGFGRVGRLKSLANSMPSRSLFGMFSNFPGSIYPKQTNFTIDLSSDELEQEPQSIGLLIW
jgi:hypothetical protein